MPMDKDLVDLIDQRIARYMTRGTTMGTLTGRDPTGPGAMVQMDGSLISIPCKVSINTFAQPGDRVMLAKYGEDTTRVAAGQSSGEWIVVGSYGTTAFYEGSVVTEAAGATSSSTWANVGTTLSSGIARVDFYKRYDLTMVEANLKVGSRTSVVNTQLEIGIFWQGINIDPSLGYVGGDGTIGQMQYNVVSEHKDVTGMYRYINMPAGHYQATARWRRTSGTGTMTSDGNDDVWLFLEEKRRQVGF